MIPGNPVWQMVLLQQSKQPLYVLEISDYGLLLASFNVAQANVTLGGYGVAAYGTGGYGQ